MMECVAHRWKLEQAKSKQDIDHKVDTKDSNCTNTENK